jgi:hypothetical protein
VHVLMNVSGSARRVTLTTEHHSYELGIDSNKPALVFEDMAGRTLAIEASGAVTRDGTRLVSATGHFIVTAEDGSDLPESQAVLLMPVSEGRVRLRRAPWGRTAAGLVAEVGEVVGGQWVSLESFDPGFAGTGTEIKVDADRAVSLVLLAPRDALPQLGERVAGMLTEP